MLIYQLLTILKIFNLPYFSNSKTHHGNQSFKWLPIFAQKTGKPYIFMVICGIPNIFMDDNNQHEYFQNKSTKSGTFYHFLTLFCKTHRLKL